MNGQHQNPTRPQSGRQFSDRLHQWMEYQGIGPGARARHLAERAGIDNRTARRYLSGQTPRDCFRLVRICQAIDAPIEAMLCDRKQCTFLWFVWKMTPDQRDRFGRLLFRLNNGSKKADRALAMAGAGQITFDQALKIAGG